MRAQTGTPCPPEYLSRGGAQNVCLKWEGQWQQVNFGCTDHLGWLDLSGCPDRQSTVRTGFSDGPSCVDILQASATQAFPSHTSPEQRYPLCRDLVLITCMDDIKLSSWTLASPLTTNCISHCLLGPAIPMSDYTSTKAPDQSRHRSQTRPSQGLPVSVTSPAQTFLLPSPMLTQSLILLTLPPKLHPQSICFSPFLLWTYLRHYQNITRITFNWCLCSKPAPLQAMQPEGSFQNGNLFKYPQVAFYCS